MYQKLVVLTLFCGIAIAKKGIPWDKDLTTTVHAKIKALFEKRLEIGLNFDLKGNFVNSHFISIHLTLILLRPKNWL